MATSKKLFSRTNLISALLDLTEKRNRPLVIVLAEQVPWLLADDGASEVLVDELHR